MRKLTRHAIATVADFIATRDGWVKCQSCGTKSHHDPAKVKTVVTMRTQMPTKTTSDFQCAHCLGEGPVRWKRSTEVV